MTGLRTVFLDRDGTLNVEADEGDYIRSPDDLHLLAGVTNAIRRLNQSGRTVIVVSNQRGVARGLMSLDDLSAVNRRLDELLAAGGAHLDAHYFCPHENGSCDCRKPAPGMLHRAAAERADVELADAVLVGDAESDVLAGISAGVATIRLAVTDVASLADTVVPDLESAVDWIMSSARAAELPG